MTLHQFWMVVFAIFIAASITVAVVLSFVATAPAIGAAVAALTFAACLAVEWKRPCDF